MVEMRWVTKKSPAMTVNDFDITYQVLQYRYPVYDARAVSGDSLYEWSEWIDVPTVTEP